MLISVSSQSAGALLTDEAVVELIDEAELFEIEDEAEGFAEAESAACSPICCPWTSVVFLEGWLAKVRLVEATI